METFSSRLAFLLESAGMTQKDLCAATSLSQGAVSKYLNGKQEPKSRELRQLSVALGVSMDSWFESDPRSSGPPANSEWKTRALDSERKLVKVNNALALIIKGAAELQEAVK